MVIAARKCAHHNGSTVMVDNNTRYAAECGQHKSFAHVIAYGDREEKIKNY